MKEFSTRLAIAVLLISNFSTCILDDEDVVPVEIISTYQFTSIGTETEAAGQIDFCGRGRSLQIIEGSQQGGSPIYTSTFGLRFEQDTVVGSVAVLVVGNDEVRDTLLSTTTSVIENARQISEGAPGVDAYVELFMGYQGNVYSSVFFDGFTREVSKFDVNGVQDVELIIDEELLCDRSRNLIIETKLRYDGYIYNIQDTSDSVKVEGFRAIIFNNSI